MAVTTLLYNQYLQTITPPIPKPTASDPIKIPFNSPTTTQLIDPSPLLSLPLELRLQIYSHALALHPPRGPTKRTRITAPLFVGGICTSLLLVSRQIYHEARPLPFQTNTFVFTKCFGSSVFSARRWLMGLQDWQRAAVRSVEIAVVRSEIVEKWRRRDGWDVVIALLNCCGRVGVRVCLQEGDAWADHTIGDAYEWVDHDGGDVVPGALRTSVMPAFSKRKGGCVQNLMESVNRGGGVRLQFCWARINEKGAWKRILKAVNGSRADS